jgi:hypothetical protein
VTSVPTVKALDANSQPVAGVVITFDVSAGGGQVSPSSVTTDSNGEATVTYWKLGTTVADNHLDASAGGAPAVRFAATIDTQFSIQIMFIDGFPSSQEQAFTDAANRWGAVIVGDLRDFSVARSDFDSSCAGAPDSTPIEVDDLLIFVQVQPIDGVGGKLAASGPCATRNTAGADFGSVAVGIMSFDSDDANFLEQHNLLETTVLHEMGHVLGIGSLWAAHGLIANPSLPSSPGADTIYTGTNGQAAFTAIAKGAYDGNIVPVDNTAKVGSADSHWRETVLTTELMSPVLTGTEHGVPLSAITIASLQDFGFYVVNTLANDPYVFGQSLVIAEQAPDDVVTVADGCEVLKPTRATPINATLTRVR